MNAPESSPSHKPGFSMETLQSGTVTLLTPSSNVVHVLMAQGACPILKKTLHLAQWGSVGQSCYTMLI